MNNTLTFRPRPTRNRSRDILEIAISGAKHPVDRGRGLIRNVKILGARSRNGGVYSPRAMATAKPLYEGARVNIDHPDRSTPDKERTFGDWFGVLENVRLRKDGLYGDLAYLTSHPLAGQVCEAAERFPASFGLSHNAQVTEAVNEGQTVYAAINRVRSVDIVCKPATTRGIFEAESPAADDSQDADDPTSDAAADDSTDAPDDDAPDSDAPDSDATDDSDDPDGDWNVFIDQMRALYDSQEDPTNRLRAGVQLVFNLLTGGAAPPDNAANADVAPVEEETETDRADRGQLASVRFESFRRDVATRSAAKPRSQGGMAVAPAEGAGERKASAWDDPEFATLRLLGH